MLREIGPLSFILVFLFLFFFFFFFFFAICGRKKKNWLAGKKQEVTQVVSSVKMV